MTNKIEQDIRQFLIDDLFLEAEPENLDINDSLSAVAGLDSVGFLELRVQCESHFGIEISDEYFTPENFNSLATLVILIEKLQAEK